ncbi:MAG: ATP-binding protein [Kofleriaceae bacterium]
MIDEAKLRTLIAEDEGQYHDRKSLLEGPPGQKRPRDRKAVRDQIAAYVAGFANAEGGVLICGVEDDGTITGHRYPADQIDTMLQVPATRLVPPQPPGRRVVLDGVELLVFEAEMAAVAVQVASDGYPYRIGDTTRQWSEAKINATKERGLIESAEARIATATLATLDDALIARAAEGAGLSGLAASDYLVRRRLADRRGDGLVIRQAAELLFARTDHVIEHPNAGVRVFRVSGAERLTGTRHNVQEFPRIEGNLPSVLAQVRGLLGTLIQRSARLHDLFFKEMPEYPTFAWQEAIVNAVAHRDYAIQGQTVEVWLYSDRLEVLSPGALAPEVDLAELREGHSAHASRNPRIARALADLGVMRDQGEGIPRMFDEMQTSFLQLPEVDVVAGRFSVVLHNEPIFGTDDPRWSQLVRGLPLAVSQKRALAGLVDREFANADYTKLNATDRDTAYRELQDLVTRGFLQTTGSGAGTRYRVVRDAVPPLVAMSPYERLAARMAVVGHVTNTDYREAFGVDRRAATAALTDLVRQERLVREGQRRGARYVPGPRWPTE